MKYQIMANGTHLGNIESNSREEALRSARTMYQNISGLYVEPEETAKESSSSAYTMSPTEMQKAIKKMTGRI